GVLERPAAGDDVLRVQVLGGAAAYHFLRTVSEHATDRRADVADGIAGIDDLDDVPGILDQGTEMLLPLAQVVLAALSLGDVKQRRDDRRPAVQLRPRPVRLHDDDAAVPSQPVERVADALHFAAQAPAHVLSDQFTVLLGDH